MTDLTEAWNRALEWADVHPWVEAALGLAVLGLVAFLVRAVVSQVLLRSVPRVLGRMESVLAASLGDPVVLRRAARVVPSWVVMTAAPLVPGLTGSLLTVVLNVAMALTVFHGVRAVVTLLDTLQVRASENSEVVQVRSIKSYVQLAKLLLYIGGTIIIVAVLLDRSPVIVLSGLGAMSAVLMLVFKDTILSFTAGVLISSNDLLRIGDWIEMPQVGADGAVVDIALHTVKVQNWDKTITTIPTWRLMSESYKNWRGMQQSGGRRIKRAIHIDATTVRFLTDEEIDRFARVALLKPYIESKREEVRRTNDSLRGELGPLGEEPVNQRRLTNIGTFRAYAKAYIEARSDIHREMTSMVRQLAPSSKGIPIEVYCFTTTTAWVDYEGIQGDVFDHLMAILPDLGLRAFQEPSGADVRFAISGVQSQLSAALGEMGSR